ncbi:MAG: hypothetical protein Q8Q50_02980 [Methylobacter sp.]|jgi:hypothetical protein|nr:hypothetical protein [Methylobacter sp.]
MKFPINTLMLASGLCLSSLAVADSVAVKGGAIFLLGGPVLTVQSLSASSPTAACISQLAGQPINPAATDIVISGGQAVVAPGLTPASADVVNISDCLSGENVNDDSGQNPKGDAKADLKKGTLDIPCLDVDGAFYNVIMNQRGNSMNWEVVFGEAVTDGSCD